MSPRRATRRPGSRQPYDQSAAIEGIHRPLSEAEKSLPQRQRTIDAKYRVDPVPTRYFASIFRAQAFNAWMKIRQLVDAIQKTMDGTALAPVTPPYEAQSAD
jgi:hypothetical protein